MSLSEYTVPAEDGMRFRHDAQARFIVKSGKKVLEDGLTQIESIGGAMTRASIMYNRLSYSGGVSWWDPKTGEAISRPKVTIRVRPEDLLTSDQLCGCNTCSAS